MTIEKRIYKSYAFKENEGEKARINRKICEELKAKYRVYNSIAMPDSLDDYDLVIYRMPGKHHAIYQVVKNETDLTDDEILLICDGDLFALCYGGMKERENFYRVFED